MIRFISVDLDRHIHFYPCFEGAILESDISNTLATYIASDILKQPKKQISGGTTLISSGLVDSFHLVDLAIFVEARFGVRIDDSELNKETFDTLDQLVALIKERQG